MKNINIEDTFIPKILDEKELVLNNASIVVRDIVADFIDKCANANIDWEKDNMSFTIKNLAETSKYLAFNVPIDEIVLKSEELSSIKGIIKDFELLLFKISNTINKAKKELLRNQVGYLKEFLNKNSIAMRYNYHPYNEDDLREGMVFKSHKSLYTIIHIISENYEDLKRNGINSANTIHPFLEMNEYDVAEEQEKTEDEKLQSFLGLLNGTVKLVPRYEYVCTCMQPVPIDSKEVQFVRLNPEEREPEISFTKPKKPYILEDKTK